MKFNSWSYLLLLVLVVPVFYVLPKRIRILFTLIVSILFYAMWRWEFALLMLFSSFIDFVAALKINATDNKKRRFNWLLLSLSINLGLLVFFKYAYFISDNLNLLASWISIDFQGLRAAGFNIILPLGISFYTFQTISYTIDVYRKIIIPTKNIVLFAAYVTFWPQLIAGPVLRAREVIPQFLKKPKFLIENIQFGIIKIIIGLFKKVVLADNIAPIVDEAFAISPNFLTSFDVWVATILFGFQIYFDFSGYSDIAIGSARLLGFKFPENFNWPYLTKSPRDFWKKWHITLSSWIRDYLYLPLKGEKFRADSKGGLDVKTDLTNDTIFSTFALFATWFIMGLWHGAGWNFALWGIYHAVYIYLFRKIGFLSRMASQAPFLSMILNFLIIMLGWIPFRSVNFDQTVTLFSAIFNPFQYTLTNHQLHLKEYAFALLLVLGMGFAYLIKKVFIKYNHHFFIGYFLRYMGLSFLVFFIIIYLQTLVQFIYFQF